MLKKRDARERKTKASKMYMKEKKTIKIFGMWNKVLKIDRENWGEQIT